MVQELAVKDAEIAVKDSANAGLQRYIVRLKVVNC